MLYFEYLRARRVFVRYALIVGAIALVALLATTFGSAHLVVDDRGRSHAFSLATLGVVPISIAGTIGSAGFLAIGIATALATGFNYQTAHAHLAFVRPESRARMALTTIAVDLATIAIAAAFTIALAFAGIAIAVGSHARFFDAAHSLETGALVLGTSFMWYAILQSVTAWAPPRSTSYAVAAGVVLALAIPLSHATLLGPIATLFGLVLYVDPLAYFTSVRSASDGSAVVAASIGATIGVRAVATWLLAAAFLALATVEWRRVEV